MTSLVNNLYAQHRAKKAMWLQAGLDVAAAGLGLIVLRTAGLKLEVGQLNMKTLLMGAGMVGLSGATGREVLNSYTTRRKDQNTNPLKLLAMAAFALGAIVLSQTDRARNLSYVGRIVSWMPEIANRNQMIAFSALSILSMVGCRKYFGSSSKSDYIGSSSKSDYIGSSSKSDYTRGSQSTDIKSIPTFEVENKVFSYHENSELLSVRPNPEQISRMEDASALYALYDGNGTKHQLTAEQAQAYNTAAEAYNQGAAQRGEQQLLPLFTFEV